MDDVQIIEITYAEANGRIIGTASIHVADLRNYMQYQTVSGSYKPDLYYIKNRKAHPKGPVPDLKNQAYYVFNYETAEWEFNPDFSFVRELKWTEIKAQRDHLEFGGFEFKGKKYDSDQLSQGRIMGAAMAGVDQAWTLQDNSVQFLTADELKELYKALQAHIAETHDRSRQAREDIEKATTKEEIEKISL